MRKLLLLFLIGVFCIVGFFGYVLFHVWFSNDISISVNDSDGQYQLYASYPRNKTRRIQHYLDTRFHNAMLRKRQVDAYFTSDDNTSFYIRTTPGRLLLRLNKNENSAEACKRLKEFGEGLKIELTQN